MAIDFGPHVLQDWYDILSPKLKMYKVTQFFLVAQAYNWAIFKGKKAFMANIWQTELAIDGAICNLMIFLCYSDDAVWRQLKEKTESLQYLRGQQKWSLTIDSTIINYCPYFKVK